LIENVLPAGSLILRLAVGFGCAALASLIAVRLRALSRSGSAAATIVGTAAVGAGWTFGIVLLGFFISGTALSRYRRKTKENILGGIVAKGSSRDAAQVLANGGIFAAACAWYMMSGSITAMFVAFGAIAGACSDTWATELGSLSKTDPRSILTGRRVPAGTSGGVSLPGVLAGVAGALFIGVLTIGAADGTVAACVSAGIAGALADSIVGASLQSRRWCEGCQEYTERKLHTCGAPTNALSGIHWINNDVVNLICTLTAAAVAALWVL
jgi:uncharacterized protein (TIGR00297 family)